jgi:starvation-inducible outer membrane lipoprotein
MYIITMTKLLLLIALALAACTPTPEIYNRPHHEPAAAGVDEEAAIKLYHQWHPLEQ